MKAISILALAVLGSLVAADKKDIECPVIGIDLGTTYSCVGVFKNGKLEIIPNEQGSQITPSVVSFNEEERLVGEAAKNLSTVFPEATIYDVKRLIGRKFSDSSVQSDMKYLPYKIVDKEGKPYVKISFKGEDKVFSPEEVSAMILSKICLLYTSPSPRDS